MWTCPKCGSKVDQGFDACWNCGTSPEGVEDPNFVRADDAPPIEDPRYEPFAEPALGPELPPPLAGSHAADLVEAYQALSLMEAKFLADQLTEAGIPALSDTQDFQDFLGAWDGNPRVWVCRKDYEAARAWLEEYERHRQDERSSNP